MEKDKNKLDNLEVEEALFCSDGFATMYDTDIKSSTNNFGFKIMSDYFVIYHFVKVSEMYCPKKVIVAIVDNEFIAKDFCSKYSTEYLQYFYEKESLNYEV